MSWQNILKRGGAKKIDFSALKTIAIEHVKTMTKEKLTREAYLDSVVKPITTKYSKWYGRKIQQHSRVENLITRLLQKEGMLESKASSKSVFEGGKTYTVWPREYEIK